MKLYNRGDIKISLSFRRPAQVKFVFLRDPQDKHLRGTLSFCGFIVVRCHLFMNPFWLVLQNDHLGHN